MKIEEYDVVRTKDGREHTVLLIHGEDEAYEVADEEDVFAIPREDTAEAIWKRSEHPIGHF
ncbi:hypothetical protein [Enterococcus diestrammenae]|uniref:hypothetical protein n=1 Tax=Enterococcus diestrammenae TaxID=1155073 RepID=UPI0019560497